MKTVIRGTYQTLLKLWPKVGKNGWRDKDGVFDKHRLKYPIDRFLQPYLIKDKV